MTTILYIVITIIAGLFALYLYAKKKRNAQSNGASKKVGEKKYFMLDPKSQTLIEINPKTEPFVDNSIIYEAQIIKKIIVNMVWK